MNPAVAEVFDAYPAEARAALMGLRALILETAARTDGVGALEETLKWGQVSYLTKQSRSGTTIRIDQDKQTGAAALYVHCQTDLVSRYRTLYPDSFDYQGERALLVPTDADLHALRHVIALALTYHAAKKTS